MIPIARFARTFAGPVASVRAVAILTLLGIAALTLAVAPTRAEVTNGDFDAGPTGWSTYLPPAGDGGPWTAEFPGSGGNPGGCAVLKSSMTDSEGLG